MIWNNFSYWNFIPNSTIFEIKFRFLLEFEFKGGWILSEFV
jgi:hypothetical protein